MDFYVNPSCLSAVFTLPAAVADGHLKLADPNHIKVILYIFRNLAEGIDIAKICDATGLDEYDVKEALLYWADAGVILSKNDTLPTESKPKTKAVLKSRKPDRIDVAKRGAEDPKIAYIMQETQMKFGRFLKDNEQNTLLWLYDDQGMDVSVIMLVIQYAVAKDKANIRFIEKLAVELIDEGIDTMTEAEDYLHQKDSEEMAWKLVLSAFGMERRKPSKKETEQVNRWVYEWKVSQELLTAAYDECVNKKSKFSFPYVAKIIENWHEKGIDSPDDIESKPKNDNSNAFAAFDLDLYEEMLKKKD